MAEEEAVARARDEFAARARHAELQAVNARRLAAGLPGAPEPLPAAEREEVLKLRNEIKDLRNEIKGLRDILETLLDRKEKGPVRDAPAKDPEEAGSLPPRRAKEEPMPENAMWARSVVR